MIAKTSKAVQLMAHLKAAARTDEFTGTDLLVDIGVDSIGLVQLALDAEDVLGREIKTDEIESLKTVADFLKLGDPK